MNNIKFGFIGFGEVASTLSVPLNERGAEVYAYDVMLSSNGGMDTIHRRTRSAGIRFGTMKDTVKNADYIFSTVTTREARKAAHECAAYLKPGKVYIDLNSTSPSIKTDIGNVIRAAGADYVEGAILGAIGVSGTRTRILMCGDKGEETAQVLTEMGWNTSYFGVEIGTASMFKMLRSIFSKGLEALLLELLIAGKRAGIEKALWEDITGFMSENPFDQVASNWVKTHAVAHERRYYEMLQVVETMRELGIEPIMSAGTEAFFKRSVSLGFKDIFTEKPDSMESVIDFMNNRML